MSDIPQHAQQAATADDSYPELTSEAKNWAMLCHLATFVAFGLPGVGHVLGPLVVWLMKRHDHPFIEDHGKESVNFQISMTIYSVLALPLLCVLIGIPLLITLGVVDIVLVIIAAIKASNGEAYRYPLTIRLVS